jgi:hypothetical protein
MGGRECRPWEFRSFKKATRENRREAHNFAQFAVSSPKMHPDATRCDTTQHFTRALPLPKPRQLASLVQKGVPGKNLCDVHKSAQFAVSSPQMKRDVAGHQHFQASALPSAELGNWLPPKIPQPPFGGKPRSVCIRVHLWFHLGVVDRRESACVGGSFVPPAVAENIGQLASLVQKGVPGKNRCDVHNSARFAVSSPRSEKFHATSIFRRAPYRLPNSAIGFLRKFPSPPLEGSPIRVHPCPSVVPSWRCWIGVNRRASAVPSFLLPLPFQKATRESRREVHNCTIRRFFAQNATGCNTTQQVTPVCE